TDNTLYGALITVAVGGVQGDVLGGLLTVNGNYQAALTVNDQGSLYIDPFTGAPSSFLSFLTIQADTVTHSVPGTSDSAGIAYHLLSSLTVNSGLTYPTFVSVAATDDSVPFSMTKVQAGPATVFVNVGGGNLNNIRGSLVLSNAPGVSTGVLLD